MGWLIPLSFVAPFVKIGRYGFGLVDVLVMLWGISAVLRGWQPPVRKSPIGYYFVLFFFGWLLASVNGLRFGINFGIDDFIILYRLGFYCFAWWIGYRSRESMPQIATSRVATVLASVAVGIAVLFYILPYGSRVTLMSLFQPVTSDLEMACRVGRVPGIGAPVNIYSFLPLVFLLFSFNSYLQGHKGILMVALCGILIVALGSRLTALYAVLAIALMVLAPRGAGHAPASPANWIAARPRNRVLVTLMLVLVAVSVSELMSRGILPDRSVAKMTGEESAEDTEYRLRKWSVGMRRVAMAPFMGIPEPHGAEKKGLSYYLRMNHPHNELLQIWMWYGLLGLLAHVILLAALMRCNLRWRTGVVWYLFYLAVIARMLFDTAFKSYHFSAVFFMIAGHNWAVMERCAAWRPMKIAGPRTPMPHSHEGSHS